jgi:hypothetical protein
LPHFPFVETLIVEVGVAEEDVRVELDEVDVRVDVTRDEEVVRMLELELDALVEELVCAALEVVRTLLALELALLELLATDEELIDEENEIAELDAARELVLETALDEPPVEETEEELTIDTEAEEEETTEEPELDAAEEEEATEEPELDAVEEATEVKLLTEEDAQLPKAALQLASQ